MFIDGHRLLLRKGLKIHKGRFTRKQLSELKEGVIYPDLPCGIKRFKKGEIEYIHKLCAHLAIAKVKSESGYGDTELYQSHRGKFGINHAQTPDPKYTMADMQYKVIRKCLLWYHLALKTGNLKWLGMMLHTVHDSYSAAHTNRTTYEDGKTAKVGRTVKRYTFWNNIILLISAKVYNLVKSGKLSGYKDFAQMREFVVKEILNDKAIQKMLKKENEKIIRKFFGEYMSNSRKDAIMELLKETLFYDAAFKDLDKMIKVRPQLRGRHVKSDISAYQYIINFSWIPNQKGVTHQLHNTIDVLKRGGLFDIAIRNTSDILEIYLNRGSIKEMFEYLRRNVINVHPRFAKMKSGRIYA